MVYPANDTFVTPNFGEGKGEKLDHSFCELLLTSSHRPFERRETLLLVKQATSIIIATTLLLCSSTSAVCAAPRP